MNKMLAAFASLFLIGCLVAPAGQKGDPGPAGRDGAGLSITKKTGTVFNKNYTLKNSSFVSIYLQSFPEPTVLFFGVENTNGVFVSTPYSSVIYGGSDPDYGYDGLSGYYLLISDPSKTLLSKNYQVKFTD